mmetsp:Transcript_12141/g.18746  ORF Transcript_12141/g.18746 Transcript_12141/m.18746 type:complete len:117 (+) Transcript_12141:117-467(+)
MLVPVRFIQWFWTATTHIIGMRQIGNAVKRSLFLSAYGDTVFYWEGADVKGYVALTIDDGLCRSADNDGSSMVKEVNDLLRSYNAHATFSFAPITRLPLQKFLLYCKMVTTNSAII